MSVRAALLVTLTLAGYAPAALADCEAERSEPKWVSKRPKGYAFAYQVGEASSTDKAAAITSASDNGVSNLLRKNRVQIQVDETILDTTKIRRTDEDGEKTYSEDAQVTVTNKINMKTAAEAIEGLEVIETYVEDCGDKFVAHALVRAKRKVPRSGSPPNPYLSAWIPSLAQFQKEETGKGVFILVGEAALVGTAVTFFFLSSDDLNQAGAATTQAERDFFNDRSATRNTVGLVAALGAGALYVYNVFDGLLTEDTINYASLPADPELWFAAAPTDGGAAASLGLRF